LPARIIDGVAIAKVIREEVAAATIALCERGVTPGLAVVLVGDDAASAIYVSRKGKACSEAGMHSVTIRLPKDTTEAELLAQVDALNDDPAVHGILVQMPLPRHMDADAVIRRILPSKDVDGFHPVNVGKMLIGEKDGFVPCTPAGVQEMLIRSGIETKGKDCVVVGRSNIVGKPVAALLMQPGPGGDATVTVCHSRTKDLPVHVRRADIIIAALGKPKFVTADMVKPGAVVIDVGINRVDDASSKNGYRIVGDVDYDVVKEVASYITPVPGGVGPMTIALLLRNTVRAAQLTVDSATSGATA
jgi:methylenetetrahydrofolate dehydrogenase (NADP+)/methenyltetrahydrofolate cyclohydrolase